MPSEEPVRLGLGVLRCVGTGDTAPARARRRPAQALRVPAVGRAPRQER